MASRRVQVVVEDLEKFIDDTIKRIALDVVANLVSAPSEGGTPIDTGWASANWIPYIGTPNRNPVGAKPAAGGAASRGEQQSKVAEIAAYNHTDGPIVVSNNVPYIVALNDGHSNQAPSGFVQAAIFKAVKEVAR